MHSFDLALFHQSLDRHFGLPTLLVEQTEEQLHSEGLLTSYLDYFQLFHWLKEHQVDSLTDVGAGLGRSSLVARHWFENFTVMGIEKDEQRVRVAREAGVELVCADIADYFSQEDKGFAPELTQSYYFYFPWCRSLIDFLCFIQERPGTLVIVTESYGDFIPLLRVHAPWLVKIDEIQSFSQRQTPAIQIFQVQAQPQVYQTHITRPEHLAAWLLSKDKRQSSSVRFYSQNEWVTLELDEIEIAFYPDRGFTLERLKPRRLYWWSDMSLCEILPRSTN